MIDKPNGGLVSARKAGYLAASGDYIISLDGDDYIADNYLTVIDGIRAEHGALDMIFVAGYDDTNGELSEYCSRLSGYYDRAGIMRDIIPNCVNGLPGGSVYRNGIVYKVVRREILLSNMDYYTESVSMGEDLLLSTACMGDSNSIYISNYKAYYYRQFNNQMTKVYKKALFINEDILIRKLLEVSAHKSMNIDNQLYRHALDIAKSTIFNEIKHKKGGKSIRAAYKQIYSTELYKLMNKNMDTSSWSCNEKLFSKLIKMRANCIITVLGKLQFIRRGVK